MTEQKSESRWSRRCLMWPALVVLVVILGVGLRIGKAWSARFSPNSDFGVAALTARHMAEGRDYPAFFYGATYMASVEPAITALGCRLFHLPVNGFTVNLGTVAMSSLLLPLLYWFGRAAGGRRAGLMAMLYALVGSDTNFHYAGSARHGYMTVIVAGFLAVWMACRIATHARKDGTVSWWECLILGLAAGLGWWATPLVIFSLATAVVILLCGFRVAMLRRGLIPGVAGFLAGGLPWWLWNATHSWKTFGFAGALGEIPIQTGLLIFWHQVLVLTELSPLSKSWNVVRLVLFLGVLALFMILLVRAMRRPEERDSMYYRLAVPVLLVVSALIFSTSHNASFAVSKYVLPLFPLIAVMVGVSCDWLLRRFHVPLGWLVFVALLPPHLYHAAGGRVDLAYDRPIWEVAPKLAEKVGPLCDGICLGDWPLHWMNFADGERLCVAAVPDERYAPYARKAELAERLAILNDYRRIGDFLLATGGRSLQMNVSGIHVDYALTPPPDDWRYLDPAAVVSADDSSGNSCGQAVGDGIMDTSWSTEVNPTNLPSLTFTFDRPLRLCGMRFLSPNTQYPGQVKIEAWRDEQRRWETILGGAGISDYFWSGNYAMLGGIQYYAEVRFLVPTGGISRVRLTCLTVESPYWVHLGEVLFLEEAPAPGGAVPAVDACVAALKVSGVKQFYGPRWMADRVALAVGDGMEVHAPSLIGRSVQEVPDEDSMSPYPVVIRGTTGFLMDERDASRSRKVLTRAGLRWAETVLGRYVLLVVQKPGVEEDASRYATLYWTEQGCFGADMGRFARQKANVLYGRVVGRAKSGDREGMSDRLQKIVILDPSH